MVEFLGAICGIVAIICSGLIADRIGRRNQLAVGAVLIAIFAFVAPWLLDGGVTGRHIYVVLGFTLLGLSFGQAAGASASRFSRNYRYSGAALTSDLAWLIGAGFAPFVALGPLQPVRLWSIPASICCPAWSARSLRSSSARRWRRATTDRTFEAQKKPRRGSVAAFL